ncbi:MAG: hypothetical protein AAFX86_12965 [Pseudomonadota bacterium]
MGKWTWTGLGLAVVVATLALGGFQLSKLFAKASERAEATVRFLQTFDGDPSGQVRANASELFQNDLSTFDTLLSLYPRLGNLESAGDPTCNWRTSHTTNPNDVDGEFVDCGGVSVFEKDPTVGFTVGWRREGETWKIYNLYFRSEVFEGYGPDAPAKPQPEGSKPAKPPL